WKQSPGHPRVMTAETSPAVSSAAASASASASAVTWPERARVDDPRARDGGATRVLVLSTVAFTLLFAVWLMFGVLGVPIKDELHLDKIQFSWLTAIAVLSGSIWRLPFGILTD